MQKDPLRDKLHLLLFCRFSTGVAFCSSLSLSYFSYPLFLHLSVSPSPVLSFLILFISISSVCMTKLSPIRGLSPANVPTHTAVITDTILIISLTHYTLYRAYHWIKRKTEKMLMLWFWHRKTPIDTLICLLSAVKQMTSK